MESTKEQTAGTRKLASYLGAFTLQPESVLGFADKTVLTLKKGSKAYTRRKAKAKHQKAQRRKNRGV